MTFCILLTTSNISDGSDIYWHEIKYLVQEDEGIDYHK